MRNCCLGGLAALFLALLPAGAKDPDTTGFDWPQWRGPRRDGVSRETGLLKEWPAGGPKLLWDSKQVNGGKSSVGRGFSSVSVAGGRVFTQGDRKGDGLVLALDEATSSVDSELEAQIERALAELMQGRTSLVIAHRLSTVQGADEILVLHHGEIRERGTHGELLRRGGLYARLYELQFVKVA